jgi:hypothetical protein
LRLRWIAVFALAGSCLWATLPLAGADGPPAADAPRFTFRILLSDLEPIRERDDRLAELFFAAVSAEWKRKGWGARAEVRGHDGPFRPYFRGDLWLEEGYGFAETGPGELRVGKLERAFGLSDETYGGNLFSVNGVTRNPDWGVSLTGTRRVGDPTLGYSLAYLGRNDHVAWEEDGRGVESDPAASLRDGLEARATLLFDKGLTSVRPGISLATSRIVREGSGAEFRRDDVAVDVRGTLGPISLVVMGFYRNGEASRPGDPAARLAYDDAWAGALSFLAEFPTVSFRYSYTEWRYRGADANERSHQPAVVWSGVKGIEATVELTARRLRTSSGARASNSVRLGLALTF